MVQKRLLRVLHVLPLMLGTTALVYMATMVLMNWWMPAAADHELREALGRASVVIWLGLFFGFPLIRWGWGTVEGDGLHTRPAPKAKAPKQDGQ